MDQIWWILISVIILLSFALIYTGTLSKMWGKIGESIFNLIGKTNKGDSDGDGIPDAVDKCPNDPENKAGCG